MIRRTFSSAPCFVPLGLLLWAWVSLGKVGRADGLYAVLGLSALGAILMPGIVVSIETLPMLLIPARWRAAWRHGRARPSIRMYLRRAVLAADGYRCCWCHATDNLQVDHIKPWSVGGLNALWNMAVLCGRCNRIKSNMWYARGRVVCYRPFRNASNQELALAMLRYEKLHRWSPLRWLRAGWSLAA